MKLTVQRESLLKPLQAVAGVVERRQTLPILSNVLLQVRESSLNLTATDLEVEMTVHSPLPGAEAGSTTLPARKFMDICRALPEEATLELAVEGERATLRSGRSRFVLTTLPAEEFPNVEAFEPVLSFTAAQGQLKTLIERSHFAMAQQDVRYYLNGLLLELDQGNLRSVATDGHRLALCNAIVEVTSDEALQVILPRKGVIELLRLLEDADVPVKVDIGTNHLRLTADTWGFTSKLIDGRFPDYQRVMPQGVDKIVTADRNMLRQALIRTSILSNEKYRSVRLSLRSESLRVQAHNPEQEEAEEEISVDYQGEALEIGFNANYLVDALGAVNEEQVVLKLSDPNSCCLLHGLEDQESKYIIMPMRL